MTVVRVPLGERSYAVLTDTPVWAVAPGQAAVLYDELGDEVLGGGRIARLEAPAAPASAAIADSKLRT